MDKRVRAGSLYTYIPVPLDKIDPPEGVKRGFLKPGDKVSVVNLPGCPKANTMGMAHILAEETTGRTVEFKFAGLVCTNSLLNATEIKELKALAEVDPDLEYLKAVL